MDNIDIEKFKRMIHKIIKRYSSSKMDIEGDLYQEGCIGVIKAYNTFEEGNGHSFESWVYNSIKWAILRALRSEIRNKEKGYREVSIYTHR